MERAGTFHLTIETGNASFQPDDRAEIARLLEYHAHRFRDGVANYRDILDVNGNTVGSWTYVPDPDPEALDGCDTLDVAVETLGIWGTIRPATGIPESYAGNVARDRDGSTWTWTLRAPTLPDLSGFYWTGSAVTDVPDVFDVLTSIVLDVTYLDETYPWTGEPELTLETVETIRDRERWLRAILDEPSFDRFAELCQRWENES